MRLKTSKRYSFSRLLIKILLVFFTLLNGPVYSQVKQTIQHDLEIWLNPEKNHIKVEDHITLFESDLTISDGKLFFLLHEGLNPVSLEYEAKVEPLKGESDNVQFDALSKSLSFSKDIPQAIYGLTFLKGRKTFSIKYQGKIYHPLKKNGEKHASGFDGTPGTISSKGIFLSGSSNWYPDFGDSSIVFRMKVHLPKNWDAVSQGKRALYVRNFKETKVVWECKNPQKEIFLVGGSFNEYSRVNNKKKKYGFFTPF